ncbi:sigma D regulator [Idiomarina sp. HP20-50]|uniref:sigma D regulator n=1 Tax=Idiomarina sp. HP20-50 TaxID=3070813 RepID=UPI00294AD950|nr:sigma D regulator [Idiomarina sp. HP20-50]MDV6316798.1 sigma D regulator [Idiomarina sp. HP20-50]
MLSRNEQAKKRWGGAHKSIDLWLSERQDLLINYFKLAALPPYESVRQGLPDVVDIRNFCGELVDYVSSGHFEIYDQIVREAASQGNSVDGLADELFPLISDTTEIALDFNDKYGDISSTDHCETFDRDLSALGEALELRMEFEDKLLNHLDEHNLIPA